MICDSAPLATSLTVVLAIAVGSVSTACNESVDLANAPATIPAAGTISPPIDGCDFSGRPGPAADAGADGSSDAGPPAADDPGIVAVGDALSIPYLIVDREADDQRVRVQICNWDGQQATDCGVAVRAFGGDNTDFIPTAPAGQCVAHVFYWDVGCGIFVGSNDQARRVGVDRLDQPLVGRVSVVGATEPPRQTDPFTLGGAGFDALPVCD